jgi:zinc transporter, ZIP family
MKIMLPFIISLIAGLSTILGSIFIFIKIKDKNVNKFITFSLMFSLSIMIGVSITDLIPNAFFQILNRYGFLGIILTLFIFLCGFIIIFFLNKKENKIEEEKGGLYKLGLLNMVILLIHNLPEGVATFMSSYQDINLGIKLGIAIMLHNIPEGIAIAVPIYYGTNNKLKSIKYTVLSGLAEPLGALLTYFFFKDYISDISISFVLLFVASLMITLSIEEILPKAESYREKKSALGGFLMGIIFIILNMLLF